MFQFFICHVVDIAFVNTLLRVIFFINSAPLAIIFIVGLVQIMIKCTVAVAVLKPTNVLFDCLSEFFWTRTFSRIRCTIFKGTLEKFLQFGSYYIKTWTICWKFSITSQICITTGTDFPPTTEIGFSENGEHPSNNIWIW